MRAIRSHLTPLPQYSVFNRGAQTVEDNWEANPIRFITKFHINTKKDCCFKYTSMSCTYTPESGKKNQPAPTVNYLHFLPQLIHYETFPCYSYHPRGVGKGSAFASFFFFFSSITCWHWKGSKGKKIQWMPFDPGKKKLKPCICRNLRPPYSRVYTKGRRWYLSPPFLPKPPSVSAFSTFNWCSLQRCHPHSQQPKQFCGILLSGVPIYTHIEFSFIPYTPVPHIQTPSWPSPSCLCLKLTKDKAGRKGTQENLMV